MAYSMGPGKIVEDGLVFYVDGANKVSYPGSGTNINNLIDNNLSGSINGATYSTSNVGVFDFDGVDDSIGLNSQFLSSFQSNIDASNAFSVSFWIKTSNTTSQQLVFGNQGNSWNQYETTWLQVSGSSNGGYIMFSVMTDPDSAPHDYSRIQNNLTTNSINDNNWHHVCCTIGVDSSTTYLVSKAYIDGTLVKTVLATPQGSYRQEIDIINNDYYIGARGSNSIQGLKVR